MTRIAQLYFPLIPIVLAHVSRLNSGRAPYISPMLGAASMRDGGEKCDGLGTRVRRAPYISPMLGAASVRDGGEKCDGLGTRVPRSPSTTDSLARSLPGSECAFRVEGSYNPTIFL